MRHQSTHPNDLFGDGMSPVRSLEPYTFEPYPKGTREDLTRRGPGGKTVRLSAVESTRDVKPTDEDDYSTETAKMRLAKPSPAAVVVEFGEMLGTEGRCAFDNDNGTWSLWSPDGRVVLTCATKQIATCYCLYGRFK